MRRRRNGGRRDRPLTMVLRITRAIIVRVIIIIIIIVVIVKIRPDTTNGELIYYGVGGDVRDRAVLLRPSEKSIISPLRLYK